ncbi:cell division protein FtsA [Moraxella macacae 0408225]|uniref:Cell division protein FtsA n=1 Tax=Moraxella macacae 0408225 TaxID=1230338 RepID=L2F9S8_9GAMM|nr:cell division protein FtsA [Moraxella macacae]ELA09640.1 cell division protein FtsA [Moraxella macacae 0408225]
MTKPDLIVVVHLSSTAVHTVIGQVFHAQDIRIIGISSVKNNDFVQGVIRHRERLKSAIKQSIQEAEDMANCRINSVWLSFSTPELVSMNSSGNVKINSEIIRAKDVVATLTEAKKQHQSDDMYLMHYVQQGIALDNSDEMIDDAIGMQADEFMVLYHLMMMPVRSRQNLQQLLQECDVSIEQMLFDAVSSAEYSLLAEEKYHGVCLIDIGSSTTSVCVYSDNKLVYTRCFPEGSYDATHDISKFLGVTLAEAEQIKKQQASVDRFGIDASQFFSVRRSQYNDEKTVNMQELLEIVEARYISILVNIKNDLDALGLSEFLQQGYVLTGGGSEMRGLIPLAKKVFVNKVHKANRAEHQSPISAYSQYGDDEKLRHIASLIGQRKYQNVFGTLLYTQSDAFYHTEKNANIEEESGLSKTLHKIENFLKRMF